MKCDLVIQLTNDMVRRPTEMMVWILYDAVSSVMVNVL